MKMLWRTGAGEYHSYIKPLEFSDSLVSNQMKGSQVFKAWIPDMLSPRDKSWRDHSKFPLCLLLPAFRHPTVVVVAPWQYPDPASAGDEKRKEKLEDKEK